MITYDAPRLNENDIRILSEVITNLNRSAETMETAAEGVCRFLYESFRDPETGEPQCALVRTFKSCSFDELPYNLQAMAPNASDPASRHLVLLATCGEREEWNSRQQSAGHQVISLTSSEDVQNIPMIANLIQMLGLEISDVVSPKLDLHLTGFYPLNVFYVQDAQGHYAIPAQGEFVIPYGIKTVIGFGGLLSMADLFTTIIFFKTGISSPVATLFKSLGVAAQELFLPFHKSGKILIS